MSRIDTVHRQGFWLSLRALVALSLLMFALHFTTTAFAKEVWTVTFDNVPDIDVDGELNGQFPRDVIDWGSGRWYLSGPWDKLTENSFSFNEGIVTASFTFVSPRQLISLDAYNGADDAAVITLSCYGQPDRQFELSAQELVTLDTGWSGTCSAVTISSSNGWYTNFDRLVIQ